MTVAQRHLEALTAATGESSFLAVSDGTVATYVALTEAVGHLQRELGSTSLAKAS